MKFKDLAKRAKMNALNKIPKNLREDTKYPGYYESDNYRFKLLKTFTSSNTHDIKGFAADINHFAIVKRKHFNLKDGFVFIDPDTQHLYQLNKVVASENDVVIYQSNKTNIFSIMTQFTLRSCSDKRINVHSSTKGTVNPKPSIKVPINWDDQTNKPKLETFEKVPIQYGVGANAKAGLDIILTFNSIWDVKILATINLETKIGGELKLPDDSDIPLPEKTLYDISIPIPSLSFHLKFLKMEISLGLLLNFDAAITDMKITIPVGFDYFKGYTMTASKYIEITPFTISDSKWNIDLAALPEINTINDAIKQIDKAHFSASLELKPYFSFGIVVGDFNITLDAGIKFPFVIDISLDKDTCMWPYLKADFSIPIKSFIEFSGIKIDKYQIINPYEKEILINEITYPSFCIGGLSIAIEGSEKNIQKDSKLVYYVKNYDFKETRKENIKQVQKQIAFSVRENGPFTKSIAQRNYPYAYYSSTAKSSAVNLVISNIPDTATLVWKLFYRDNENSRTNVSPMMGYINFNQFSFPDSYRHYIRTHLYTYEDKSDTLEFYVSLEKCQYIQPGKIFSRNWNYVVFQPPMTVTQFFGMMYFTETGKIEINDANFLSDTMVSSDYSSKMFYYYQLERDYSIYLVSIESNVDCRIEMDLMFNEKSSGKSISLGTFSTGTLTKNKVYTAKELNLDDILMPVFVAEDCNLELKGKIFDSSENPTSFSKIYLNYINTNPIQTKKISDDVTVVFHCDIVSPYITADCSGRQNEKNPPQELLARAIGIDAKNHDNTYKVSFYEDEMYLILSIKIPTQFQNQYLAIITDIGSELSFLYTGKKNIYNENFMYINVGTNTRIYIVVRRKPDSKSSYSIHFAYFVLPTEQIDIMNRDAPSTKEFGDSTMYQTLIVPLVGGKMNVVNYRFVENSHFIVYIDNNTIIYFYRNNVPNNRKIQFFLNYAYISDQEPSITINTEYMQSYKDIFNYYEFHVYCKHGEKVLAQIGEKSYIVPIKNTLSDFKMTEIGDVTFIPICHDNTEMYCQITYETPENTGYHLIKYPNRDGISTTGSGFYAEIIPVIKGKNFTYYQTYTGAIEKVREYSEEPIQVEMKVDDLKNYKEFKKARRFCLLDLSHSNVIVPFSRVYFSEHMDELLDVIGFDIENGDYRQLTNDENGCIYFNADFIKTNDIKEPASEVCDLPIDNKKITLDTSKMTFKPKSKFPTTIVIAVVVVVVVVIVIIVVVVVIIKKKKKKKMSEEDKNEDQNSTMEDL